MLIVVRPVDEVNGINIAAIKVFDLEPPSPVPAIAVHPPANLQAQLNTPKQIEVVATGAVRSPINGTMVSPATFHSPFLEQPMLH